MGLTIFLMTQKGLAVLDALTTQFPALVAEVVGSRDASIDKDYYEEIKSSCERNNILFWDRKASGEIQTRYALAISWRWIINAGASELIVLHDSLLPAIAASTRCVHAHQRRRPHRRHRPVRHRRVRPGSRHRAIVHPHHLPHQDPARHRSRRDELRRLVLRIARILSSGDELESPPQDETQATYSLWRDEGDYFIDWTWASDRIKWFADAVGHPYKGAIARLHGRIVRVRDCDPVEDIRIENRSPGKVIFVRDSLPVVVCGSGLLRLTDLVDDESKKSLLPLPRFRCRFG